MFRRALFRLRAAVESVAGPLPTDMLRELRKPWLRALGVRTVIDVGASVGQFASIARSAFPDARILSFEPLPDCVARLRRRFRNDPRFEAFPFGLGAANEERELQHSDYAPSSSLRAADDRHRSAFPSSVRTTALRIEVKRLDDVLAAEQVEGPLLFKLDVQGSEREVLQGAPRMLERASLVLLEASLQPLYSGEALFGELHDLLASRGFLLAGLSGSLRDPRDGRPLQVDALFERARPRG